MCYENTRRHQLKLLEIMQVFHEVCLKNDITYYMIDGTMLGAIRHKGFIPWDDDMDIGLPRVDYEKLLCLPQTIWPSNLFIKTPYNSKDLIFPYAKLIDSNTTLIEDRLDGILEGIYIDIFPLDGVGSTILSSKIRYYVFYWKQGLLYYNQDYGLQKTYLRRLIQKFARSEDVKKLYMSLEESMKKYSYKNSLIVANYPSAYGFKEYLNKEIYGTPLLYDFEGLKFYGVNKANEYLTSIYGNYMELPPVEKRKSHHRFKYLNLDQPFAEYFEE